MEEMSIPEGQKTSHGGPANAGQTVKTSRLAIASFALSMTTLAAYAATIVLGVLYPATGRRSPFLGPAGGLITLLSFFILLAPAGYFTGRRALRKIKASEGTLRGRKLARFAAVAGGGLSILLVLMLVIPGVLLLTDMDAADSFGELQRESEKLLEARRAYQRGDFTEAVLLLEPLAEQGVMDAQVNLGIMFAEGLGVPRDAAEAVRWFRSAAEGGNPEAQSRLGVMYCEGLGVGRDDAEAVRWFRKAAEQDHPYAQNNLGAMYAFGRGVAPDDVEAVRWYRRAAERDNEMAQFNLGNMYAEGRGVPADVSLAVEWYFKAGMSCLKQGDTEKAVGCLDSIRKYGKGNKLEKKLEEAIHSARAE